MMERQRDRRGRGGHVGQKHWLCPELDLISGSWDGRHTGAAELNGTGNDITQKRTFS